MSIRKKPGQTVKLSQARNQEARDCLAAAPAAATAAVISTNRRSVAAALIGPKVDGAVAEDFEILSIARVLNICA